MAWVFEDGLYIEKDLEKHGVLAFITTTQLGDMKDKNNRNSVLSRFKIKDVVCGEQVHGKKILIVSRKDIGNRPKETDGYITDNPETPLCIFTADCMPVFIYDKRNKVISALHAGRAGLEKGIVSEAVGVFLMRYGTKPEDVIVSAGPHINNCCYPSDLQDMLKKQLAPAAVSNLNIFKKCTHDKEFFSYRRNKTAERMMSLIMLER